MRKIGDDRVDLGGLERAALDLAANGIEALRRCSRAYGNEAAGRLAKPAKCRFGKTQFVATDQAVVVRDQQRRQQDFRAAAQFDATEAAKYVRLQGARVARNHHNVFPAGIQTNPANPELRAAGRIGVSGHFRDRQCENRIGSGGFDSRLLVAPPSTNSRHREWP